jgi:lipid-A-disaccharide synthase
VLPSAQFVIARAPNLDDRLFEPAHRAERTAIVAGDTDTVLAASDLTLTASGTATVQAALHDTPMVVVYRVAPLEYRIGRRLVTLDTFAMVNLIAQSRLVPELIQDAFTPDAVAREALAILTSEARTREIRSGLADVRRKLGGPGASGRAARAIVEVCTR